VREKGSELLENSPENRDRCRNIFMNIRGSAHRPLQNTSPFIIILLFCIVSGCRKPAPAPVTVTFLDQEWSQPDELSRAEREFREFTRETGIAMQHPPVPETLFSSLPPQAQLDLLRRLLQEGGPSPDVLGIDVIWLAEKDIVPDNRVKKEKVQRCTSEQHDFPSFGVRLPVLWDMRATPIEGLPNILS
jgi:hypothetical protein